MRVIMFDFDDYYDYDRRPSSSRVSASVFRADRPASRHTQEEQEKDFTQIILVPV